MSSAASRFFSFEKSWLSRISFSSAEPFLTCAFLSCSSRVGNFAFVWGGGVAITVVAAMNRDTRSREIFFTYFPFLKTFCESPGNGRRRSKLMPSKKSPFDDFLAALLTQRSEIRGHGLSTDSGRDPLSRYNLAHARTHRTRSAFFRHVCLCSIRGGPRQAPQSALRSGQRRL